MRTSGEADLALQWLAGLGVTPLGPDRWRVGAAELTDDDVAFSYAYELLYDDPASPVERVRTALGLLDLTGGFGVMIHLDAFVTGHDDPAVVEACWTGVRARLEAADPIDKLRLHLRTGWFVGNAGRVAFAALLGDDVRRLRAEGRLPELAGGPLHHRARHVLADSAAVGWAEKHDVLLAAAGVTELHPAVYRGLLGGCFDPFGDLEPAAALAVLERLDLPAGTEGWAELRAALRDGVANHHHSPPAA